MAWRCGGPCPHDAVVKNVATTTSPTSSSEQSPRRSGTSACGSSPASAILRPEAPLPWPSPCCAAHAPPAVHHPPVQTQGRILHLSLRAVRAPLALSGSTAKEVARRLGISAETVDRIVENQLTEDRQIDPQRVVTDIGLDESSLKKRHRLDVTLTTLIGATDAAADLGGGAWQRHDGDAGNAWIGSRRNNANRSAPIGSTWGRLIRRRLPRQVAPTAGAVTDRFHVA